MSLVNVCGFRDTPKDKLVINTTSRSNNWSKGLSPFYLGPVPLYDGYVSKNMENAWQYSKVYKEHTDVNGNPSDDYWAWAKEGWKKNRAERYPMGKARKPEYLFWAGRQLSYIEARKKVYIPLYRDTVVKTAAFKKLCEIYDREEEIWLWDFDGYDFRKKGMSFQEVMDHETLKMGHAFVLAMMLEGKIL